MRRCGGVGRQVGSRHLRQAHLGAHPHRLPHSYHPKTFKQYICAAAGAWEALVAPGAWSPASRGRSRLPPDPAAVAQKM